MRWSRIFTRLNLWQRRLGNPRAAQHLLGTRQAHRVPRLCGTSALTAAPAYALATAGGVSTRVLVCADKTSDMVAGLAPSLHVSSAEEMHAHSKLAP